MAEIVGMIVPLVESLIGYLQELADIKKHSRPVVQEIASFTRTLNENLRFLRTDLPQSVSKQALESVAQELQEANRFMEECRARGRFKSLWNAKEISANLKSLREKLVSAFQMAFIITSLDVAIDGHKRISDFQTRMLELSSVHTSNSAAARVQIQELLRPVIRTIRRQDGKLKKIIDHLEESRAGRDTESTEAEKFFADVLAAIDQSRDDATGSSSPGESSGDEELYDPITTELMCDPVKGSDGITYDRWTILDNGISHSPTTREPLSIVCDDINLRRRLFQFPSLQVEKKFLQRRQEYKSLAFELAKDGHDAESLEMLDNVLKWAPQDPECHIYREAVSSRLAKAQACAGFISGEATNESAKMEAPGEAQTAKAKAHEVELASRKAEAADKIARMEEQLRNSSARVEQFEAELASKDSQQLQATGRLTKKIMELEASLQNAMDARQEEVESRHQHERELFKCLVQAVTSIFCFHVWSLLRNNIACRYNERESLELEISPEEYVIILQSLICNYREKDGNKYVKSLVKDLKFKEKLLQVDLDHDTVEMLEAMREDCKKMETGELFRVFGIEIGTGSNCGNNSDSGSSNGSVTESDTDSDSETESSSVKSLLSVDYDGESLWKVLDEEFVEAIRTRLFASS